MKPTRRADVIGATRGWPAVITFAAVSETLPRGLLAEPQLYGFFADEIFRPFGSTDTKDTL